MSSSKITVRDVAPRIRATVSRPADTLGIVGVCQWGPINKATVSVDYEDWVETFGSYLKDWHTAIQVQKFFENGGKRVKTVRVVTLDSNQQYPKSAKKAQVTLKTSSSAAATKGYVVSSDVAPFALVHGGTLVISVNGAAAATATFNGTAATLTGTNTEPFAFLDGDQLRLKVDGGSEQIVTLRSADFADISAATAEEVVAVINRDTTGLTASGTTAVTLTSNTAGTGSSIDVTGGSVATILGLSGTAAYGTGNVANIASVTVAEAKTIIEAAVSGCTVSDNGDGRLKIETNTSGSSGSIKVDASSTLDDEFGFDNLTHIGLDSGARNTLRVYGLYEGARGNNLSVKVTAASSGVSTEFNLEVYEKGSLVETFSNLTMDTSAARYVETVVNNGGSKLVSVEDLDDPGSTADRRPADLASTSSLADGNDGVEGISDTDFVGSATYGTGIHAFDSENDVSILIAPDRPTSGFQASVKTWLETTMKNRLTFIPDVPAGLSYSAAQTHASSLSKSQKCWGLYWPRIKIANPDTSVYGTAKELVIAVSGAAAGRKAKNTHSLEQGPFVNPTNELLGRLVGVTGVENEDVNRESIRDKITPSLINPVRAGKTSDGSFGVWLDDAQVLDSGNINWKSIGESAGVSQIVADIMDYLETRRGQPMTQQSRQDDEDAIESYLAQWAARGVFASKDASQAYYVNTDPEGVGINNPTEQEAERYNVSIGLATARAGRFINILVSRYSSGVTTATVVSGK